MPVVEPPPQRAPSRELLLANHRFPGEYTIKAFGPATDAFRENVHEAAKSVVGSTRIQSSERVSRAGNSVAITLLLSVFEVDEVEAVYERLYDVSALRMIL